MLSAEKTSTLLNVWQRTAISVIAIGTFLLFVVNEGGHTRSGAQTSPATSVRQVSHQQRSGFSFARFPLAFEENQGQAPERVRFLSRGPGYVFLAESDEIRIFNGPGEEGAPSGFSMRWLDGRRPRSVKGVRKTASTVNYFLGNDQDKWVTSAPRYEAVRYEQIYPGIDLLFYGNPSQLEFDLLVSPGADPNSIQLDLDGLDSLVDDGKGGLFLRSGQQRFRLHSPVAYQEIGGERVRVEAKYRRHRNHRFSFEIGSYTKELPLIIDPVVSASGSFLGGSNNDGVTSLGRDAEGNLYVAGFTRSSSFISSPINTHAGGGIVDGYMDLFGPVGRSTNGSHRIWNYGSDAFVMKVSADLTELQWATYLGGQYTESPPRNGGDAAFDIAIDGSGNVLVTGATSSPDFPGADNVQPARWSAFVSKIDTDGTLAWSSYLGGGTTSWGGFDATNYGFGVATDNWDNVYVTGTTGASDFPTTTGAFQSCGFDEGDLYCDWIISCGETHSDLVECDGTAAFVVKMDPEGERVYATYLTSTEPEWDNGVQVPGDERAAGGHQYGAAIAVDDEGRAFVVGSTTESRFFGDSYARFPTHPEAYLNGIEDGGLSAFISVLSADGSALEYSTLLGGSRSDEGLDIDLDSEGNVYVTGYTTSEDFPTEGPSANGIAQGMCRALGEWTASERCGDAFVTKFNPTLSDAFFSRYLGGEGEEFIESGWSDVGEDGGTAIDLDSDGNVLVAGYTNSEDFPTQDATQDTLGGKKDGFATKLDGATGEIIYSTYLGGVGDEFVWDALAFDVPEEGSAKTKDREHELVVDLIAGESSPEETLFFYQIEEAFSDLVQKVGGWLVSLKFTTPYRLIPEGIGYDSFNYDPGVGALQSTFTNLKILGTGLIDVEEVVFENGDNVDVQMETEIVSVSNTEVVYNLIVEHGAPLGTRTVILKQKNGKPDIELRKDGFLVTKVAVSFNQAVDDRSLKSEEYRRVQISGKHGVVRVQFDNDRDRDGETYRGELRIIGRTGATPSIQDYPVMGGYTEQEILDGRDYLTMPYPGTDGLPEGDHTFFCDMYSAEWHIRTPDLTRTFIESEELDIVTMRVSVPMNNGTVRNPPYTAAQQVAAISESVEKLFPLSSDQLWISSRPGLDLHWQPRAHLNQTTGRLSDTGESLLGAWLRMLKSDLDETRRERGNDKADIFIALLPADVMTPGTLAAAWQRSCVIAISDQIAGLGPTVVHEIGHTLGTCMRDDVVLDGLNLGDEYEGGQFNCETNPPAATIDGVAYLFDDVDNEWVELPYDCALSPLVENVHADRIGSYTSESGFDPVLQVPMFYANTTPGRRSYNYMSAGSSTIVHWVSSFAYNSSLHAFAPLIRLASGAEKQLRSVLEVDGWLHRAGSGAIEDVRLVEAIEPDGSEGGYYKAELHDNSGSLLGQADIDARFFVLSNPPRLTDRAMFQVRLPVVEGAAWIVIRAGTTEVTRLRLGGAKPELRIIDPQPGHSAEGTVNMTWTAGDEDSDSLRYDIKIYPDTEEVPFAGAVALKDTTFTLDLSEYDLGPVPEIGVIASDGYNETEDRIQLNVASGPRLNSITPASIQQGASGVTITLNGSGFVDGASVTVSGTGVTVSGTTFVTSSEIDATLSVASDAPLGMRDVRVTNPDNQYSELTSALQVTAGEEMDVQLMWQAPDTTVANGPPQNLIANIVTPTRIQMQAGAGKRAAPRKSDHVRSVGVAADPIQEIEPNNFEADAQMLYGPAPVVVEGQAEDRDEGDFIVEFLYSDGTTEEDDIEDLYLVTTTESGLKVTLDGFDVDSDLYVLEMEELEVMGEALTVSDEGPEVVEVDTLSPGTYFIGVSIYDTAGAGSDSTSYQLTVEGSLKEEEGGGELYTGPTHYRIYRSGVPDAVNTGAQIGEISADAAKTTATSYVDEDVPRETWFYEVTAVYSGAESGASNEVEVHPDDDTNRNPEITGTLADITLLIGADPFVEDLETVFTDPDGDDMTYLATSSNPAVASAVVTGSTLRVTALAVGYSDITVIASDGRGGSAVSAFRLTVPSGIASEDEFLPAETRLFSSYPNPLVDHTTWSYELASTERVTIEIYSLLGQRVAVLVDREQMPGRYQVRWDGQERSGASLPAGAYVCRMQAGRFADIQTVILLR